MKNFTRVMVVLLTAGVLIAGGMNLYSLEKETKCQSGEVAKKCQHEALYKCPVDGCKYTSEKPGKCPECGKELIKKEACKIMYRCPAAECKYSSDKPGKCPKCGKELKKVECSHAKKTCEETEAAVKCSKHSTKGCEHHQSEKKTCKAKKTEE